MSNLWFKLEMRTGWAGWHFKARGPKTVQEESKLNMSKFCKNYPKIYFFNENFQKMLKGFALKPLVLLNIFKINDFILMKIKSN